MSRKQKITTYLWFDNNAEEAPKGSVMMATFQLEGQEFMALSGGPHPEFTEAISLFGGSWRPCFR